MKILLACSAGMSTSMLEKAINDYMLKNNIEGKSLALSSEIAKNKLDEFDIILLGPQVKYMLNEFKSLADSKPVAVIPPSYYAMANGQEVYNFAKKAVEDFKK